MQIVLNHGARRYFISDNYFYLLGFTFSLIFFLRKKQKQKRNMEGGTPTSGLNCRGGDNSVALQKLTDKCFSGDSYVEVNNSRVRQIVRIMLNIPADKPIIISVAVFLLAILKNRHVVLTLQNGAIQFIISNIPGIATKAFVGGLLGNFLVMGLSAEIVLNSVPLLLVVLAFSHSNIGCNSFVDTLPEDIRGLQYIETINKNDAPVIVAPHISKPLYHKFDETEVSLRTSLNCYIRGNCLGPEPVKRKGISEAKRFVPLSERTKTIKDLKYPADETDIIDINSVKYRQKE
jgi:hypothetical protein